MATCLKCQALYPALCAVHVLRGQARRARATTPTKGTATMKIRKYRRDNARAEFIRSIPFTVSVDEVIRLGEQAGIKILPHNVHQTRSYMRKAGQQPGDMRVSKLSPAQARLAATMGAAATRAAAATETVAGEMNGAPWKPPARVVPLRRPLSDASERDFLQLAVRIGYDRARALVESILTRDVV